MSRCLASAIGGALPAVRGEDGQRLLIAETRMASQS
jgi:hypothetical protein